MRLALVTAHSPRAHDSAHPPRVQLEPPGEKPVAERRAGHRSFAQIIEALQPDWVVLRPVDARQVYAETPPLRETYRFVRAFDVRPAVDAVAFLPGRGYLNFDAVFLVYQRATPNAARP